LKDSDTPGPGEYPVKGSLGRGPKTVMAGWKWMDYSTCTPGPGAH